MATEFNTTEYRFSHGHEPKGRGSWAFEIPGVGMWWTPGSTTYTEAKKMAAARVREMQKAGNMVGSWVEVKVCP